MRWLVILFFSFATVFASEEETVDPPTSFAREVMQPIGMPIVSVYHHIKESPFLNMTRPEATGLEAIGDFFLTPSRYLFGGKTIKIEKGQFKTTSDFDYGNYNWLKTSFSILSLPVCELL